MGAESSAPQDGRRQEDAAAPDAEVNSLHEGGSVLDIKSLQKNGQITSMSSLNGLSEDSASVKVGQPDGVTVAQKDEAPDTMDTVPDEVAPQVNGEKVEKDSPDTNDITAVEERVAEEKTDDTSEVGFKKIFRFVGFKFTLKKDKSEEKDPVKLLTVKDKEGEETSGTDDPAKEEEAATAEEKKADTEAPNALAKDTGNTETTHESGDGSPDDVVKEEGIDKESETGQASQEIVVSPFRKLFSGGLFSNLRKKASIKKTKEEEDKEVTAEEGTASTEESGAAVEDKEEKVEAEQDVKEEGPTTPAGEKSEPKEVAPTSPEEPKIASESPKDEEKGEPNAEEEKASAEVTSEAEQLSAQEKVKLQGSPLKKLFTGAGLKKLSTKKQKSKRDAEVKLTESGEQAAEQLQSSTESGEVPNSDSGPSSPEESGEHAIDAEAAQVESSQETDGEVLSDGEKKKEGIIAWSSFKKLVTPKKRVKRSSESEDEAASEKPTKPTTLSSTESAALGDKSSEDETKEEKPSDEEPKTETTEKLLSSTEEPKKKMDNSVSWEALMCMGGPKKRTRRTSDSDDEETKIGEEIPEAAAAAAAEADEEQDSKPEEALTTQVTESEEEPSSPEPSSVPPERESAWDTLKRMVMPKNKPKMEEKSEETTDQVQSDSEAPKDDSSFSLRKFFPGLRKKKVEKQASTEQGLGDEDSDTPAVVPLSEYDDTPETEETSKDSSQARADDRAPSWIPANVEDGDDKLDQLSDIPEEMENGATPKSVGNSIAENETEDHIKQLPKIGQRRLSTAEVKPVAPAPSTETTGVSQTPTAEIADKIVAGIEAQIHEIPSQKSVTLEDVPVEAATTEIETEPPTETAESKTNTILEPHTCDEAMAICTGLGTKEIAKVALEKPVMPVIECVAVVRDALSSEVALEIEPADIGQAIAGEDEVLRSEAQQIETFDVESIDEMSKDEEMDIQAASMSQEPEIEKFGIVSTVQEESEVLQPTTVTENSPKTEIVNPITPTSETAICNESFNVTELNVQTKAMETDTEQLAATEETAPVKEVVQVVANEITSSISEATKAIISKDTEPNLHEVVTSEEVCVITETVVLTAGSSLESDQVTTSDVLENVVETVVSTVAEQVNEETGNLQEEIKDNTQIENQGMVIAQAVIQDAIDQVSEDATDPKKPTNLTDSTQVPVHAVATFEKEIEIASDVPVITDTPVSVECKKPSPKPLHLAMEVIDTIALEIAETLDAPADGESKSEEKLEKAGEEKTSEEEVTEEEVVEITAERQTTEEVKEEPKQDVKEDAEDVIPQVEETKVELAPENESKGQALVVLQTAQVVEELSVAEEVVVEFDSNGPVDISLKDASEKKESEEPQASAPTVTATYDEVTEAAAGQPETVRAPSTEDAEIAQVIEVSEEAVKEADSNGPVDMSIKDESEKQVSESVSTQSEEPQVTAPAAAATSDELTEAAASQPETEKAPSKCAEVMAQVIEVIEEAVKEIEPASAEMTTAS